MDGLMNPHFFRDRRGPQHPGCWQQPACWRTLLAGVFPLLLASCGGPDLPDRARVEGTVTLDGTPVTTGEVMFVPDTSQGNSGPPAMGTIDAEGHYELTTDRSGRGGDGAVVGWHKVRVQAREDVEPGEMARSLVPERYGDEARSRLVFEVKAGEVNEIDLELQSGK